MQKLLTLYVLHNVKNNWLIISNKNASNKDLPSAHGEKGCRIVVSDRVGELDLSDCSDFTESYAADITISFFSFFYYRLENNARQTLHSIWLLTAVISSLTAPFEEHCVIMTGAAACLHILRPLPYFSHLYHLGGKLWLCLKPLLTTPRALPSFMSSFEQWEAGEDALAAPPYVCNAPSSVLASPQVLQRNVYVPLGFKGPSY